MRRIIKADVNDDIIFNTIEDVDTGIVTGITSVLKLPTGNLNNILIDFNFINKKIPEELRVIANFNINEKKCIDVELRETTVGDKTFENACYIPAEVFEEPCYFMLGLYGFALEGENDIKQRISLIPLKNIVVKGSYDPDAQEGITPTPTVFEIYFEKINTMTNDLETLKTNTDEELQELISNTETAINELQEEVKNDFNALEEEVKDKVVPVGGTTGQVLAKKSNADNDTEWVNPPEGGSGESGNSEFNNLIPVAGVIKPTTEGWQLVNDGTRQPLNINGVSIVDGNITLDLGESTNKLVALNITPNKKALKYGFIPSIDGAKINLFRKLLVNFNLYGHSGGLQVASNYDDSIIDKVEWDNTNKAIHIHWKEHILGTNTLINVEPYVHTHKISVSNYSNHTTVTKTTLQFYNNSNQLIQNVADISVLYTTVGIDYEVPANYLTETYNIEDVEFNITGFMKKE